MVGFSQANTVAGARAAGMRSASRYWRTWPRVSRAGRPATALAASVVATGPLPGRVRLRTKTVEETVSRATPAPAQSMRRPAEPSGVPSGPSCQASARRMAAWTGPSSSACAWPSTRVARRASPVPGSAGRKHGEGVGQDLLTGRCGKSPRPPLVGKPRRQPMSGGLPRDGLRLRPTDGCRRRRGRSCWHGGRLLRRAVARLRPSGRTRARRTGRWPAGARRGGAG